MRKRIPLFLFCLITLLFNISCKKDSSTVSSRSQLLTDGNWTLVFYRYNFNNGAWNDGYATLPDCQKDNKLFFNSDLTYILDEGATKCNSSDPQIFQQGIWALIENETKLVTNTTNTVEIVQLDASNLKTIRRDTLGTNITITEANYIH